jgi:hypothetical protein
MRLRSCQLFGATSKRRLAFAIVFSLMVERSIAAALINASFSWLVVSVAAWYLRRKMRSVQAEAELRQDKRPRGSTEPLNISDKISGTPALTIVGGAVGDRNAD